MLLLALSKNANLRMLLLALSKNAIGGFTYEGTWTSGMAICNGNFFILSTPTHHSILVPMKSIFIDIYRIVDRLGWKINYRPPHKAVECMHVQQQQQQQQQQIHNNTTPGLKIHAHPFSHGNICPVFFPLSKSITNHFMGESWTSFTKTTTPFSSYENLSKTNKREGKKENTL